MSWTLGAGEPAAASVVNPGGDAPFLLVADHASARVPEQLDSLGLPESAFSQHIAVDVGVYELTLAMAERLNARAVVANYSRLVIDLNRTLESAQLIPDVSDGQLIPGNQSLTPEDVRTRVAQLFEPYHALVAQELSALETQHPVCGVIAVHSFTPHMDGFDRPWEVALLWNDDARLVDPAFEFLRQQPGLVVGDNEPYSARGPEGYTMPRHAERPGRPHVLFEVRQDLLADDTGVQARATLLANTVTHAWTRFAETA